MSRRVTLRHENSPMTTTGEGSETAFLLVLCNGCRPISLQWKKLWLFLFVHEIDYRFC